MVDAREPTQQELTHEIASIDRAIHEALFYGGGLQLLINGDEVLRSRGGARGLAIYDDIERDAHAGAVLDKRKRAVTAREWHVQPASDDAQDIEIAEFCKNAFRRLRFDRMSKDLLDAVLKGFAVIEIIWDRRDDRLVPVAFKARNQRRFTFDVQSRLRLLSRERPMEGEELPNRKFIVHSVGGKDDLPYGRGLGARLFWPVFFKRQNISFWLIFNEKFGSPTALGKYPTGAGPVDKKKLLTALQAISQDAAVIIPEGMEAELLEATRSGSADGYERLCAYMDAEISKAVLGETLTTTVGNTGGNRALGDVHDDVRMELAKDDADDLSYTLNATLMQWIVDLNWPGRAQPEVWRVFDLPQDVDAIADRDTKLSQLGWERTEESFAEVYGPGYTKVERRTPFSFLPRDSRTGETEFSEQKSIFARLGAAVARVLGFAETDSADAQRQRNRDDQEAIAAASEHLGAEWEQAIGPRIKELQTLLDETGDLSLFRDRLKEMIDREPSAQFVEQVARATFAARLQGRLPRK